MNVRTVREQLNVDTSSEVRWQLLVSEFATSYSVSRLSDEEREGVLGLTYLALHIYLLR